MTRRYNLFIDGQNVPADFIPEIMAYCSELDFEQNEAKFYASTGQISGILGKTSTLLADNDIDPVPVKCKPRKNSVDIRIAVDVIEAAVEDTESDVLIIVTNDSDFTHVASRVISYRQEFHLLYTGNQAPTGYSPRVRMARIKKEPRRALRLVEKVKEVAAGLATPKPKRAAEPRQVSFDPDYHHEVPMVSLSPAGWTMRIRATSPVVVDSRSLFRAWRDFTAHAWKGKASKKTPQQFWDEQFAGADFRFVQWPGLPLNQGYFLSREYAALAAESGSRNATLSIIGMEPKLLRGQCIVLARALAAGGYANFDELYQTCMADNVLPRYAAWAIVDCWLRRDAAPIPSADWSKPLVADAAATDELLRSLVEREIRHQFETGVVALVNAADGGDPSQKATSA